MQSTNTVRFHQHGQEAFIDTIACEEVLNIDIIYGPSYNHSVHRLASTMRTPGHDRELVVGLLYSLDIINSMSDIVDIAMCPRGKWDPQSQQTITIMLSETINFSPVDFSFGHARYSSCGVCGSSSINASNSVVCEHEMDLKVSAKLLTSLPSKMFTMQEVFSMTGGCHAAALFDNAGILQGSFEDVGRHNALDKLIGHMFAKNCLPLTTSILLLSSRASFEIVQKAARAGIRVVAVIGAITSLALDVARQNNITLVGFLRPERLNVYTHTERIF
jgi:FdhD protein